MQTKLESAQQALNGIISIILTTKTNRLMDATLIIIIATFKKE
jgi:hypothetical protein